MVESLCETAIRIEHDRPNERGRSKPAGVQHLRESRVPGRQWRIGVVSNTMRGRINPMVMAIIIRNAAAAFVTVPVSRGGRVQPDDPLSRRALHRSALGKAVIRLLKHT